MTVRKLPVGIQSFENIRRNHYLYVDKTEYIWNLDQAGKVYFLSRPRRFGKSLLISTMEAYFQGKKELFEGLAIEELEAGRGEEAWQSYPVLCFSLSGGNYNEASGLKRTLDLILSFYEEKYGVDPRDFDLPNRFRLLIESIFKKTGKQVVVLVDEYDKPLLETMVVNPEQEEKNRQLYKGFFSVLKDEDKYLKFVFFTGVTKFSKVSVFSDLNQLRDISLSDSAAGLCGITEEELRENFDPEISAMAAEQEMTREECLEKLAEEYDGYHFSKKGVGVYNPFSILNAFEERDFRRYWFDSATSTFVVRKLLQSRIAPEDMTEGIAASERRLTDYRGDNTDPVPLLYQAGYLTITGFDRRFRIYTLKFPNAEVKYGFLDSLVPMVLGEADAESPLSSVEMIKDLERGEIQSFMVRLESLFAGIPYPEGAAPAYEREWRGQVFLIFSLLGEYVGCEVHSATGRADCVVKTRDYIYIIELKLDKSADEALQQIEDKGYAVPYKADSRKKIKVGVNFSSEKRNIEEWKLGGS